jgi:acyl carrier protein phosphodiesterase
MNWLAHLYLSEDDIEYRIGNVIADWVKGEARLQFVDGIQRGLECHKAIDLFTDAHPIVARSKARIQPPFGRFGFDRMAQDDWLGSYERVAGIDVILKRMSRRLSRPNRMGDAISELVAHYSDLREDFHSFFPQLQAHVQAWRL